jgi:Uncharacterized protein conserved in bacteria (DUF2087)
MSDSRVLPPELSALQALVVKSGVGLGGLAEGERELALALLAAVLPPGAGWSEPEVNQALRLSLTREASFLASDAAELRRWLVDLGFWRRDGFGRRYERCPPGELPTSRRLIMTALAELDPADWVARQRAGHAALRLARRAAWAAGQGVADRDR